MIELPCDDAHSTEMWQGLIELAESTSAEWTLIGAQMVQVHGLEHGRHPPRASRDLDLIVNVRAVAQPLSGLIRTLETLDYELEGVGNEDTGHRFVRGTVMIDVLAPDGVGRPELREVFRGVRTVEVPGGTQALQRTEEVRVVAAGLQGVIRRPSLLGAILVKARSIAVSNLPEAQRRDLAFLFSLVEDPFELASAMKRTEHKWLRRVPELSDPSSPLWRGLEGAESGANAYRVMADS